MVPGHEALASGVQQYCPLAADSLGDQEGRGAGPAQGRGVKLDELHVHHFGAGPEGQGDAVARSHGRVGGVPVHLPGAPGSQHQEATGEGEALAAGPVQGLKPHRPSALDHDGRGQAVLPHGYAGLAHGAGQRRFDMGTGGVAAGVEDAGQRVAPFSGQGHLPLYGVEGDAQAHQVLDGLGRLLY